MKSTSFRLYRGAKGRASQVGVHMTTTTINTLPEPPLVKMPFRELLYNVRNYHTGCAVFRDAAGPISRVKLLPKKVLPPVGHRVLAAGDPRRPHG